MGFGLLDRKGASPGAALRLAFMAVVLAALMSACADNEVPEADTQTSDTAGQTASVESEGDEDGAATADPVQADGQSGPAGDTAADPSAEVERIPADQLQLELTPVDAQFRQPLFVTHAGDDSGRIFVVEKAGTIRIVQDGQLLDTPFLDITDRVQSSGNEMGLLGLAFSPNFAKTGHFFVNYTGEGQQTTVARFSADPANGDTADPGSEFTVLQFDQPAGNHNGGMLAFGPDGYLYIGTGDGGASFDRFGNGQNPSTLLGKMLRLDVTSDTSVPYTVPTDNPWIDVDWNGNEVLDEVWAVGLRNPWRYSFDRETGDLWIGDVGQNQFEEINRTPADSPGGLNYGWPIQEGSHCLERGCDDTGLVQPEFEYDHAGGHCSVTGGYVYRGDAYPEMQGIYFYGDYCSGTIWAAAPDTDGSWQSTIIDRIDARISSFGEDEAGELYLTDIGGGRVYRLSLAQ